MLRFLTMLFSFLLPTLALAQLETRIDFRGQATEEIRLEKSVEVTRPVPVQVPSTCYRAEPYQVYECNNETRYRQECSWIPESENCWTDYDRVCRPVTRSRRECSTGPSRRECTPIPTREVCTERPTREVCRRDSNGQERCTTVGGGRTCNTVGGGETCRDIPGQTVCRDVGYTDQECSNVARNRCERIPGRNDCRDLPYSEEVCGNVTRYNQIPYACMVNQYVNKTEVKKLSAMVNLMIEVNGAREEFPLQVKLIPTNARHKEFTLEVKLPKEPKVLVVLKRSTIKLVEETASEIKLAGEISLELIDRSSGIIELPSEFSEVYAEDKTGKLTMVFKGKLPAKGFAEAKITHKPFLAATRTFGEPKGEFPGKLFEMTEIQGQPALEIQYPWGIKFPARNFRIELKLKTTLNVSGEILNVQKPESIEREFVSFITVYSK